MLDPGCLVFGIVALPLGNLYARKCGSGLPFWLRPKQYMSVMRPYSERRHRQVFTLSRQITLTLLGGWAYASRYTDESELLDENYERGKIKYAVNFDSKHTN